MQGDETSLRRLRFLADLKEVADAYTEHEVSIARGGAVTWRKIGEAMGVSAQAVQRKYREFE
ncbi:hypothetical protein [Kitasatospora sp. NPDC057198]|uniref:hypothetical protein n=1 Tax=Kitasatospora sp. NPDC057198 TaxID=3346046 RepID=UPI00362AF026